MFTHEGATNNLAFDIHNNTCKSQQIVCAVSLDVDYNPAPFTSQCKSIYIYALARVYSSKQKNAIQ